MAACLKLTEPVGEWSSPWKINPAHYAAPSAGGVKMRLAVDPEERAAEAVRIDHSLECHRKPRVRLKVSSVDSEQIQAMGESALVIGERVAIKLEARSRFGRATTMLARVERCWRMGDEFAITFGFEPLYAA